MSSIRKIKLFNFKRFENKGKGLCPFKHSLLVEGDAEYILMDAFFKKVTTLELSSSGVHIISV